MGVQLTKNQTGGQEANDMAGKFVFVEYNERDGCLIKTFLFKKSYHSIS